jgi:cytochrome c biogenesis protein CcmG/thiol:disulfide interchange protein DsbE
VGQDLPLINPDYINGPPDWKGKPLLLEFWATWCPPCRESIPHLNGLYAKYGSRGLVVLGISDEDREAVRTFAREMHMQYFVACDPSQKLLQQFHIHGIPHAFLVDRNGKIVWEGHPGGLTDDVIEKVLIK